MTAVPITLDNPTPPPAVTALLAVIVELRTMKPPAPAVPEKRMPPPELPVDTLRAMVQFSTKRLEFVLAVIPPLVVPLLSEIVQPRIVNEAAPLASPLTEIAPTPLLAVLPVKAQFVNVRSCPVPYTPAVRPPVAPPPVIVRFSSATFVPVGAR